jgi:uncharacterized protein YfaS (alpha-2-macroglobulin family)/tetratricopeptide (TPR) repeat protein
MALGRKESLMRRLGLPVLSLVVLSVLAAGHLLGQDASPEELLKLGDTWFAEKTFKKAVEAYERLLAAVPAHPEAHRVKMNLARCHIGLNQWALALKGLREMIDGTKEGTRERAEVLALLGGTSAQRGGGSKEVWGWLEEAQKTFGTLGDRDARMAVLFELGFALSYSYDYGIEYADFERDRKEKPDSTEPEWDVYQRRRMRESDEARYARTVEVYREIVSMDGGGHMAARARYMLGCFHVNVLASVFNTDADFYPEALPADEMAAKRAEILDRYLSEVAKGIAVLREVVAEHPADPLADDAQYLIAVTRKDRLNEFKEAEKEYEALLVKWPATEWADTARASLQEIRKEEVRLAVGKPFRPREGNEVLLTARNVGLVRFAAYRLDLAQLLKGEYVFHDLAKIDTTSLSVFAEWEVPTGIAADRKGVQLPVKLPFSAAGSFLVVATGEATTCRVLTILSDLAIVVRTGDGSTMLYAVDGSSGEPREGVRFTVKAVARRGRNVTTKLYEGVSGADGLAVIPLDGLDRGGSSLSIVARQEDHVAVAGEWTYGERDQQPFRVYTFTDRPVYRPGQTVHLKSIVRAATEQGLKAVDGKAVKVEVADPQGRKLLERTLATGAFGSVSADLALEAEPALGVYQVRVFIDGQQYYTTGWTGAFFRVEEYKKPEFEVVVDAGASRVRPGEAVTAKVGAKYYFGAPVAAGEATWQVFRTPYRHFMAVRREYRWYYEDMYAEPHSYWTRELVTESAGPLDADGAVSIPFPTKEYEDGFDSRFEVLVKVTDGSRREINGSATVFATKQSFFVRAETVRQLMKPGDAVEVSIRAEDANRKPVASEGKLVLSKRVDREEEKDGKKVPVVDWVEAGSIVAKTGEDGAGVASIVVDETGAFRLSYVTAGDAGEEIRGDTFVWVVDRDFRGSQYRFSGVEITTDGDTFAVGGEMKVFVRSQFENASIVLTVEADREILYRRVVKAEGRACLETIPVGENWVPNVFVKAMTVHDEAVFTARTQVVVPPVRRFLDVKLTPAKTGTWLPGEEAKFTVTATDANGEPARAELSIGFIDASILYIAPDHTPDIRQFFYGKKRGDDVSLSSSFDFSFSASEVAKPGHELPEYRTQGPPQFMNPWFYSFNGLRGDLTEAWGAVMPPAPPGGVLEGEADGGGFGSLGGGRRGGVRAKAGAPSESLRREAKSISGADAEMEGAAQDGESQGEGDAPPGEARKFFPDTAFWDAHVETDPNGKAEFSFPFPDSLTTWKATVRGATVDTSVGSAAADFVTTKNVIIRLEAPRFFRERDEVVVSGIVHNYFDEALPVTAAIRMEGDCLVLLDRGELGRADVAFTVGPKKEQRIDWWFKVVRPGEAKLTAWVKSDRESDTVQFSFPALQYGAEKYTALAGSFTGPGGKPASGGAAELRFEVPAQRHEEASSLVVSVSPTIAGTLLETLPYLADYPYGCVEQTMSRFVPALVVKKTLLDLGFTLESLGVKPERELPEGYWGRPEVQKLKVFRDEELAAAVGQGLKRLADFQKGDGSWGWWKESPSDLRMTAYVVRGLGLARAAGVEIDVSMLERGAQWLFGALKNVDLKEREEKGMGFEGNLYVAAATALLEVAELNGEPKVLVEKIVDWLDANREKLGATSRGLLAIALDRLGKKDRAIIVCENLTDQALLDRDNGTVRFGRNEGSYGWQDDAVEATSTALRAYLRMKPESDLIAMMVKWLAANRRGAHWKSTMDTAQAVLALCDYLRVSRELTPDLTVRILVDGKTVKTVRLTKDNVFTADNQVLLRGAELAPGARVVRIEAEGTGNLYYSGALTVFTTEDAIKGAGNEILVSRNVFRIHTSAREVKRMVRVRDHEEERTFTELVEEKEPIANGSELSVGDELEMEVVVTAKNDYQYLVFEDMKGAGFEPLDLLSGHAWGGILSYQEFRDERVAFFCSRMPQGEHRLSYRVRAQIPGVFQLMPAAGHAMYLPDVRAISDGMKLSITEPGVR